QPTLLETLPEWPYEAHGAGCYHIPPLAHAALAYNEINPGPVESRIYPGVVFVPAVVVATYLQGGLYFPLPTAGAFALAVFQPD
ncbi:hypothetical protein, partial [Citrobacter sp. VF227]